MNKTQAEAYRVNLQAVYGRYFWVQELEDKPGFYGVFAGDGDRWA